MPKTYFAYIEKLWKKSKNIIIYEPRHEKTGFLPRRKQRRRSASR